MNMTAEEIAAAVALMEAHMPPSPCPDDAEGAFEPASFALSAGRGQLFLRFADRDDAVLDLALNQAVAVAIVTNLAKLVHALDWADSAGHIIADPAACGES
ncbi:MAG: hypothetical protein Q4G36_08335 [Paracoccus sp. (in: a-proteobacteria)]|nr:hypothetical protein [Paracoccus sp. (in: a-proteobacteria)]